MRSTIITGTVVRELCQTCARGRGGRPYLEQHRRTHRALPYEQSPQRR